MLYLHTNYNINSYYGIFFLYTFSNLKTIYIFNIFGFHRRYLNLPVSGCHFINSSTIILMMASTLHIKLCSPNKVCDFL